MRTCSKCKILKEETEFTKRTRTEVCKTKSGLQSRCKTCRRKSSLAWYSKNKARSILTSREWKIQNYEQSLSGHRAWLANNRDKCSALENKRKASKSNQTPSWVTKVEHIKIADLYKQAGALTKKTGIIHHVDHIIPLNGKYVKGFHCLANLQILTDKENLSKGNRIWPDMPDYSQSIFDSIRYVLKDL
jgi:hypothetical protein